MKTPLLGSAVGFASLLMFVPARPLPAADPPAPGGVEKQALQAGVYRTPASPSAAGAPAPRSAAPLTVLPAYQVMEPGSWLTDRLYYRLKAQLAWRADEPHSLIFEEFAHGPQIRAFEAPQLSPVDVPWSPMVTEDPVLSASNPNYVSDKLQARFPLVNVVW